MGGATLGVPTGMGFLGSLAEPQGPSEGVETSDSAAALLRFRSASFEARPEPPPKAVRQRRAERAAKRQQRAERERAARQAARDDAREARREEAAAAAVPPSVSDIILAAGAEFGVDGSYLLSVASCESDLDPDAVNGAGYHGLFQFDEQTWAAYGYGSIYDPVAQARTAARLLAAGHSSRWPNCA
ncbi:hypothetical protein BH24ACT26_BH24ACT26_02330 [soil metagenome]